MTIFKQGCEIMRGRWQIGGALLSLVLVYGGLGTLAAQEIGAPEGDIPEWLEGYGYQDDLNYDGVASSERVFDRGRAGQGGMDSAGMGPGIGACDQLGDDVFGCDSLGATPCQGNCGPLCRRQQLTGDWFGHRTRMQENGITYQGRTTHFFFGIGGGVNPPVPPQFAALGVAGGDQFEYTGNSRHDLIFDLEKFGGLPYGKFIFTLENVWGQWGNVSLESGALAPPIFNSLMPIDLEANGIPRVTNFLFVQPLSEQFIVTIGKTRLVGVADNNIFAGGDGSDQFLNQALVANPLFIPQLPFSGFAIGAVMPQEWGNVAVSVIDPLERSTDFMDFGTLFSTGAILFGQVQIDTDFFDLPGEHHFGGFYKNADQLDLAFATNYPTYPYPPAPPGTPAFQTKSDSYTLFYGFDQYVTTYGGPDAAGNTEGWGIFGRAGIADGGSGNPNFLGWFASAGIGGNSPLMHRRGKGDRFGIGYAFSAASSEFGVIPQTLFGPRDAQVLEAFYRYRLTPAIEITPDIQWVKGVLGGLTDGDDAIIAGFRLNMIL